MDVLTIILNDPFWGAVAIVVGWCLITSGRAR